MSGLAVLSDADGGLASRGVMVAETNIVSISVTIVCGVLRLRRRSSVGVMASNALASGAGRTAGV